MLTGSLDIEIVGQHFTLLKEKAAYWQEEKTLLIADVHAGKASHFRNNGIPLSTDHLLQDLNAINTLCTRLKAEKLCFLGDLYHTSCNIENTLTDQFLNELNVEVELIIGNHDRHSLHHSKILHREAYSVGNILLSHEPQQTELFNIYGHLHPAYALGGKGRQRIKLPSFYVGVKDLILPAFGSINGGRMYKDLAKDSKVVLVSEDGLIEVN